MDPGSTGGEWRAVCTFYPAARQVAISTNRKLSGWLEATQSSHFPFSNGNVSGPLSVHTAWFVHGNIVTSAWRRT